MYLDAKWGISTSLSAEKWYYREKQKEREREREREKKKIETGRESYIKWEIDRKRENPQLKKTRIYLECIFLGKKRMAFRGQYIFVSEEESDSDDSVKSKRTSKLTKKSSSKSLISKG